MNPPRVDFYQRHGWRGARALSRLVVEARNAGLLLILDAKRADVGEPVMGTSPRGGTSQRERRGKSRAQADRKADENDHLADDHASDRLPIAAESNL